MSILGLNVPNKLEPVGNIFLARPPTYKVLVLLLPIVFGIVVCNVLIYNFYKSSYTSKRIVCKINTKTQINTN